MTRSSSDLAQMLSFYAVIIGASFTVAYLYSDSVSATDVKVSDLSKHYFLIAMILSDLVGTAICFCLSLWKNNSTCYDPYWSVAPPLIFAYWIENLIGFSDLQTDSDANDNDHTVIVLFAVILTWSVRMNFNFLRSWPGMHHEDWRYVEKDPKTGLFGKSEKPFGRYWTESFFLIHLYPTILVFLGLIPAYILIYNQSLLRRAATVTTTLPCGLRPNLSSGGRFTQALYILAAVTGFSGVIIETVADEQLRQWKIRNRTETDTELTKAICSDGLWSLSRHPNYFGELLIWLSMAVFGLSSLALVEDFKGSEAAQHSGPIEEHLVDFTSAGWVVLAILGFVMMCSLFSQSAPMMDGRNERRRGEAYKVYREQVPNMIIPNIMLLLWPNQIESSVIPQVQEGAASTIGREAEMVQSSD